MEKLLFSVEDITPKTGFELVKEQYFVMFGYDPNGKANELSFDDNVIPNVIGNDKRLSHWFFGGITPIFKVRKGRKHIFSGGLPLYYGPKTDMTSIYVVVMESDQKSRDAGLVLRDFLKTIDTNSLMQKALELAAALTQPEITLAKEAFSLAIKALEEALIRNGDDISYTNVFTFKNSNNFLLGTHDNWGNQRVDLTFSVEQTP